MSLTDYDLRLRIESDFDELHEQHGWNADQLDEFIAPIIDRIRDEDDEEEEDDESE